MGAKTLTTQGFEPRTSMISPKSFPISYNVFEYFAHNFFYISNNLNSRMRLLITSELRLLENEKLKREKVVLYIMTLWNVRFLRKRERNLRNLKQTPVYIIMPTKFA